MKPRVRWHWVGKQWYAEMHQPFASYCDAEELCYIYRRDAGLLYQYNITGAFT